MGYIGKTARPSLQRVGTADKHRQPQYLAGPSGLPCSQRFIAFDVPRFQVEVPESSERLADPEPC